MFKKISSFWEMIWGTPNEREHFSTQPQAQKKRGFTPTYLIIAEDLNNKTQKVFEAAVYYLCVIAKQKTEYQNDILKLLSTYLSKVQNYPERVSYIKEMLSYFDLDKFIHN